MDDELAPLPQAVQVAHPSLIPALAVEADASTARAGLRGLHRFYVYSQLRLALGPEQAVSMDS
jgi:hypothetical protein